MTSTAQSSHPQSTMLEKLATDKPELFHIILQFAAHPQTFLAMGQTCRAFKAVCFEDKTWKILVPACTCDLDFDSRYYASTDPNPRNVRSFQRKDFHSLRFFNDPRLPTAFEQVMVERTVKRMGQELESTDNIFLSEFAKANDAWDMNSVWDNVLVTSETWHDKFVWSWLQPQLENLTQQERVRFHFREDFVRAIAGLLEANVVDFLKRSMQIALECNQRYSPEKYPVLEEAHCKMLLNSRNNSNQRVWDMTVICVGSGCADIHSHRLIQSIVRRLAYRAGIVKLTHNAYLEVWRVCVFTSADFLNRMHLNLKKTKRDRNTILVPTPKDLEIAAEEAGLWITRYYDENTQGDAFFKDIVKQHKEEWTNEWGSDEKFADCQSIEGGMDMDIDLDDYDSDSYCRFRGYDADPDDDSLSNEADSESMDDNDDDDEMEF